MTSQNANRADGSPVESVRLGQIARARSGDKGTGSNIGVFVGSIAAYDLLRVRLTAERVADFFRPMGVSGVERYELRKLKAFNFVLRGILSRGTRVDAQGKALGQAILELPIEMPPGDGPPTESREP